MIVGDRGGDKEGQRQDQVDGGGAVSSRGSVRGKNGQWAPWDGFTSFAKGYNFCLDVVAYYVSRLQTEAGKD